MSVAEKVYNHSHYLLVTCGDLLNFFFNVWDVFDVLLMASLCNVQICSRKVILFVLVTRQKKYLKSFYILE